MTTKDARHAQEIKSRIVLTRAALNQKKVIFLSK